MLLLISLALVKDTKSITLEDLAASARQSLYIGSRYEHPITDPLSTIQNNMFSATLMSLISSVDTPIT